jgi:hypothetical protein
VDGDEARGRGQGANHGPFVIETAVEPLDGHLGEIRVSIRIVPCELRAIVRGSVRAQQRRRACVVQMRLVQHDQPGITERVGPFVVVMRRVAELVDGEVVRLLLVTPHEVVCRSNERVRRGVHQRIVDEDVDVERVTKRADQLGGPSRDARSRRRDRAEPREPPT